MPNITLAIEQSTYHCSFCVPDRHHTGNPSAPCLVIRIEPTIADWFQKTIRLDVHYSCLKQAMTNAWRNRPRKVAKS